MIKRLGKFEIPNNIYKVESTSSNVYACFVAEPFEVGYGHTLGSAFRRILLSSIEGHAISSIKIEGVYHEFQSIDGVLEDVTEIILNLKKVLIRSDKNEDINLYIDVERDGVITAKDIQGDGSIEIINPDQIICTLSLKRKFLAEMILSNGRGYKLAEDNKLEEHGIGVIPIDTIFSPVKLVKYSVENTRIGKITNYDKLLLEIWTDGRITPEEALKDATSILIHHLEIFDNILTVKREFKDKLQVASTENNRLKKLMSMSVNEIELSVRAANCLNNANITSVEELCQKTEAEMLKYRNFGKKSLTEIKGKLEQLGLSLGMNKKSNI